MEVVDRGHRARRTARAVRCAPAGGAHSRSTASWSAGLARDHPVGDGGDEHVQQASLTFGEHVDSRVAMRRCEVAPVGVDALASSTCSSRPTARRSTVSCGPRCEHGSAGGLSKIRPALAAVVDVVEVETGLVEELGESDVRVARGAAIAARRPWPASGSGSPRAGSAARSRRPSRRAACGSRPEGTGTAAGRLVRRLGGNHRAAPGSGGRSGTPVRCVPTKSRTVQNALPVDLRSPRPSCCRNSVGLSVGRSISTVSTAGTSTPSLNRSTENTTRTRPAARSRSAASRSARGLSPQMATAAMPWRLKWWAMKRACSMLTQNPRARIVDGVGVLGDLLHDEPSPRVGAGVGVAQRVDVVAAATPPRDVAQVEAVVDAEVQERRQVLLVDGVPEPKLGGDAIVEPVQDRQPVAAFRGCGQAEQLDGREVVEDPLVRRRGGVVELVDDHDVEVIRRQARRGRWRGGSGSRRRRARTVSVARRRPTSRRTRRRAARSGTWRGSGRGSPRGGR